MFKIFVLAEWFAPKVFFKRFLFGELLLNNKRPIKLRASSYYNHCAAKKHTVEILLKKYYSVIDFINYYKNNIYIDT